MPRARPTRIIITGHVVFDPNFGGSGDIHLYWRDVSGAAGEDGGGVRPAQPGYFSASIFDGSDWRKLQLSRLLPYAERAYQRAVQRPRVAEALRLVILQWRGESAQYHDESRTFRLAARELY
ncbi:hypothetical protein PMM47T1_04614 [Pseudomonas sp. M47T1]|uniref:hypothetical protein n=1 Tax=Pseudomonas sp. M47T1 TaxID=1179778 RepID=UPI0002607F8F|nr:hypothetical protein [Pseudomonas sp. M47T1]EIK97765.1 hypothetical protein PMM47T1_04614 [Pseudomonas sp. M47T1]